MQKNKKTEEVAVDVICGMDVDPGKAAKSQYMGETYYFCCPVCKQEFEKSPEKHAGKQKAGKQHAGKRQ